ncbi:MAG: helix-turn-helix domain-containing protein [Deltaproteobacteria bacterium]|nr:helix-turn-helix domain-containing protein [Candidatus Tharpella aukensis]
MSINEKELLKRDSERNIGDELLQMVREMRSGKSGRKSEVEVSPIVMARHEIGHTQVEFAKLLGVSLRTLQEWEQGRRQPSGAAKSLIAIAIKRPDILKEVLAA